MIRKAEATCDTANVCAKNINECEVSGNDLARLLARFLAPYVAAELRRFAAGDWCDQTCSPLGRRRHRELASRGAFPAYKEGRRWRARLADVEAYIQTHPTGDAPDTPGGVAALRMRPATDAALHEDDAAVRAALAEAGLVLVASPSRGRRCRR